MNPWTGCRELPPECAAVLAALHLSEPRTETLHRLSDAEWRKALEYADQARVTLVLRRVAREQMPEWVRERTDRNASQNLARLGSIEELYRVLAAALGEAGVPYLALKGLTHCPDFGCTPAERVQYDIDLFVPREEVLRARDRVTSLGFESMQSMERFPTDHLPVLIRKTGWEWRGDMFDTEIPTAVELHFRLWNPDLERLPLPETEKFFERRGMRALAGTSLPVLRPADALAYACLHVLRHVLRGNLRPFHVYEIARLLETRKEDTAFWTEWRESHTAALRRVEAVVFRLAAAWFGCEIPEAPSEDVRSLPARTQAWFDRFALSPATVSFHSHKPELWLHFSLLSSRGDRWRVARRRLLPSRLPGPVDAVHIPAGRISLARRVRSWWRYSGYVSSRARHHLVALARVAWELVRPVS